MQFSKKTLGMAAAFAMLAAGCAAPKVLRTNDIVGDRAVRTIYQSAGTADGQGLYNYYKQICDYDAQGQTTNCGETLVLTNVVNRR